MRLSQALWALQSTPELCHPQYALRFPEWQMMRDCSEGQSAIQERAEIYLPRRHHMRPQDYLFFLGHATFFNATGRTVQDWKTRIFRRPPSVIAPFNVDTLAKNGRSFRRLLRDLTDEVLKVNRVGYHMDIVDEEVVRVEPYVVEYAAEDILWWAEDSKGPTMVLLRYRSPKNDTRSMFSSETDERCRLLALDENREYFILEGPTSFFSSLKALPLDGRRYIEIRQKRLDYIPFYIFSSDGDVLKPARPLALDIAHINLKHYRATARLEMARHYAGSPIYVAKYGENSNRGTLDPIPDGDDEETGDDALVIASEFLWEMGKDDTAEILETKGTSLPNLAAALNECEQQMRVLGARVTMQSSGAAGRSASSDEMDTDSHEASLTDVVESISRGAETMLRDAAEWRGVDGQVTVQLNRQFTALRLGARELRAVDAALGQTLPPKAVYYMLLETGWIPDDMSLEQFEREVLAYRVANGELAPPQQQIAPPIIDAESRVIEPGDDPKLNKPDQTSTN